MNESSHMKPGIVKYSGNGEQLWVRIDSSSLSSQSTYMDIDKNNNIYILGSVAKPPLGYSYTTIKYDSSGAIQWQKHDLQTSFGTYPFCIKLDNQSNVYLTGYSGSKMNTLKYSQPQVGINNSNIQTPNSFKLFQNFPNPFNPSTYIKYQMIKDSYVQLILFDVLGRELETLINERQKAGIHKLMWDASKYPSGVYFYKLVTDKYS